MSTQEATVLNADLWSRYFQNQWSSFLNPFGVPAQAPVSEMAEGTAARVAGFLTLVAAGPIAWMYSANAPGVMATDEVTTDDITAGDDVAAVDEVDSTNDDEPCLGGAAA